MNMKKGINSNFRFSKMYKRIYFLKLKTGFPDFV